MLSIAYRMVGSFTEAEDLVQEAFLRLHQEEEVENPRAWLTTVTTRLAIDHLRSARVVPVTWCPRSTSCGTRRRPSVPVAPERKMRRVSMWL